MNDYDRQKNSAEEYTHYKKGEEFNFYKFLKEMEQVPVGHGSRRHRPARQWSPYDGCQRAKRRCDSSLSRL